MNHRASGTAPTLAVHAAMTPAPVHCITCANGLTFFDTIPYSGPWPPLAGATTSDADGTPAPAPLIAAPSAVGNGPSVNGNTWPFLSATIIVAGGMNIMFSGADASGGTSCTSPGRAIRPPP